MRFPSLRLVPLFVCLAALASCGSGIVAIISGDGSNSGGAPVEPPVPTLVTSIGGAAPLLPPANVIMAAVVQNYELPATLSRISVELRAFGDVVDHQPVLRVPNSTTVEFFYGTGAIQARTKATFGPDALTAHDVQASLAVLVDGEEIAEPISLLLLRQPTTEIEGLPSIKVLSSSGQTLEARLKSVSMRLPETTEPVGSRKYTDEFLTLNEMRAKVAFGDDLQNEQNVVITSVIPVAADELRVFLAMPSVEAPIQAHFLVDSLPSGRSSLVSNLFYRPEVEVASPATGATEGGTTFTLFGQALVPVDPTDPTRLNFERLELSVHKGGRRTIITSDQIRQDLPFSDRLEFTMPPAPDGRPGPVDVHLEVEVDAILYTPNIVTVETRAVGVFTYGDSYPYFGPRGATLRDSPVAVRYSPFVDTTKLAVDGIAILAGPGGMPYASVLRTRGNGLFTRFGQPVRAGVTIDIYQRFPVDVCIADFIGDGTRSGVIINRGFAGFARHSMIAGSGTSNPPISFNEHLQLGLEESGRACAIGDFNEDDIADVVVISSPTLVANSVTPLVFLSDGSVQPTPRFVRSNFSTYPGPFLFEAVDVSDVDSDGELDLVFAQGGGQPRLLVAFGDGRGNFPAANVVDLSTAVLDLPNAGYVPNDSSRLVGLHVVGSGLNRSIVLVFSGIAGSMTTPPTLVHVRPGAQARTFERVIGRDLVSVPGGNRVFLGSAAGDLTGDGVLEVAVVADMDEAEPLRVLSRTTGGDYRVVQGGVDLGAERLLGVRGVSIGVAAAPGTHHQPAGRTAVFVSHSQLLGTVPEERISTFLSDPTSSTPKLISPHAARMLARPVKGMAIGRFFPKIGTVAGDAFDVWVATDDEMSSLQNDGVGELKEGAPVSVSNIIPSTLTTVVGGVIEDALLSWQMPAFLTVDGRLGVVLPTDPTKVVYAGGATPIDFRTFAPFDPDPVKNLRVRDVQSNSSIKWADVNQDGIADLVVFLGLAIGPSLGKNDEMVALLLLGKPNPLPSELSYVFPDPQKTQSSLLHGNVSAVAVGDFVTTLTNNFLELAVTLPNGGSLGNEVQFHRWDDGDQAFVRSFASPNHHALPVGDEPVEIVAGDYNSDGRTDIAVASRRDHSLWVFYNFSRPTTGLDVDLTSFQGAPANPLALPTGDPGQMLGEDINGDGVPDVIVAVSTSGAAREQQLVYYLSPGSLAGSSVIGVPEERTGNQVYSVGKWRPRDGAAVVRVGDLNGDGAPDLILGWDTAGVGDYNLRVLFGNNF